MKSNTMYPQNLSKATNADLNKLDLAMYLYNNASLNQMLALKGHLIRLLKKEKTVKEMIESIED